MQMFAKNNLLNQRLNRYRCGSRRACFALTPRLCLDSRQFTLSNCWHRSTVNRPRRMHMVGQWSPQLAMGTESAVVPGCLPGKITSRLVRPYLLREAASSNAVMNQVQRCEKSASLAREQCLLKGSVSILASIWLNTAHIYPVFWVNIGSLLAYIRVNIGSIISHK